MSGANDAATSAAELVDRLGVSRADVATLLAELDDLVTCLADDLAGRHAAGEAVYPEVAIADVLAGTVPADAVSGIRRTGCAVIRGTIARGEAEAWDAELGEYLARNGAHERIEALSTASAEARIWGVYWSRPQVLARQHDRMVAARRFLNGIWRHESGGERWFDPDLDIAYPDRVRRREPGAGSPGLNAHVDSPVVGGWRILENQRVFAPLLAGGVEAYDPYDAAHRTAEEVESPVGCTVFRTFQGWTALSEMQPADGVLHVVPIPLAAPYRLVHGLAGELGLLGDEVPAPRRDGGDATIRRALVPIPAVEPGDTVWWHGDLYHSVADAANDTRWGNVMYIGSSPRCPRNDAYRAGADGDRRPGGRTDLYERFLTGASPRDFPGEDVEVDFVDRGSPEDLTVVGRAQFGVAG